MKTKYLILGALLSVVSAIFQCIPALFSEIFIFLTIFLYRIASLVLRSEVYSHILT